MVDRYLQEDTHHRRHKHGHAFPAWPHVLPCLVCRYPDYGIGGTEGEPQNPERSESIQVGE